MKKFLLVFLLLPCCCLPLAACGESDNEVAERLSAPENLRIEIDYMITRTDYYICWDGAEGADYYFLSVADVKDYLTYDTRYYFESATAGETYSVSECAVSGKKESEYERDGSTVNFSVEQLSISQTAANYLTDAYKAYIWHRR